MAAFGAGPCGDESVVMARCVGLLAVASGQLLDMHMGRYELRPMHRRVIARDVYQAKITECAIVEHEDGRVEVIRRQFGAFKRDHRELVQWALQLTPEMVIVESAGVYW